MATVLLRKVINRLITQHSHTSNPNDLQFVRLLHIVLSVIHMVEYDVEVTEEMIINTLEEMK